MKMIEIHIREKDKKAKNLSLFNLREEIVNFLYKDTIAASTRSDLIFFVLLFFISVKEKDGTTAAERVFKDALPKLDNLNRAFQNSKNRIKAGEYQKLVETHGLKQVFQNDVFFVLVEAVLNLEEIEEKYRAYLKENKDTAEVLTLLSEKYATKLKERLEKFQTSEIEDDRYDDRGNYHDLSKSVYRTVKMRNSRNLDINLQRYTSVKEITSKSPIDLTFFQHIDPQIVFDLWDRYHLAEYIGSMYSGAIKTVGDHIEFKINAGDLINGWLIWKMTEGSRRKEKKRAKEEFENQKLLEENNKALNKLVEILSESVVNADKSHAREIARLRKKIDRLSKQEIPFQDKERIEKLKDRLEKLENLEVSAKVKKK